MKFNIGDRVQTKLTRTPGTVRRISNGLVAVETDDPNYGVPLPGFEIQRGLFLSADAWEKISPAKIVITSDGKTTLARLYDGNRIIRRAKAKCSPEDTYDFATGANLAYDRLMQPPINHAAYILNHTFSESALKKTSAEDKPKFEAGDKAKVIANTCHHHMMIGDIVTLTDNTNIFAGVLDLPAWHYKEQSPGFISERDLEPYAEHAAPANKYDAMSDDNLVCAVCDMGWCSADMSDIRHADCPFKNTPAYDSATECRDYLHAHPEFRPVLVQYLVDEDAAKEPKPEPKPVKHLYSGKVVCVETHDDFTVGKVYTFKDGKVTDDSWNRRPMNSYVAESLEDWNSRCGDCIVRFVEYKGEAT